MVGMAPPVDLSASHQNSLRITSLTELSVHGLKSSSDK